MTSNQLKDSRHLPISREALAGMNQSLVFDVFPDDAKLTMTELVEVVGQKQKSLNQKPMSERTIRRAIATLIKRGFVKQFGRQGAALLYGKVDASFASSKTNEELIPLAGNLVTVEDFIRLMVSPESKPLKVKNQIIGPKSETRIRRVMAHAIYVAGDAGMTEALQTDSEVLYRILDEVNYLQILLRNFLESPIWFAQYRDRIGFEMRKLQENDPELFQLTVDFIKGG